MSIAPETDTDFEGDISVPVGTDMFYSFSISPLDATGCTASFITTFGTFTPTITISVEGDVSTTTFSIVIPNASLPAPGVYTWRHLVSFAFSPPVTLPYGHGGFYVKTGN